MQPVNQRAGVVVHGVLEGHGAVKAVVVRVDVGGQQRQHGLDVEHGVVVEAAQGVVGLQLRAGSRDAAVGHAHGAAGDVLLLEELHGVAHLEQAGGADQARSAGAHDHDVDGGLLGTAVGRGLDGRAEVDGGVATGVVDGLAHGALDGQGGQRGAGEGVDLDALSLDDLGGQLLAGIGAHAHGLVVAQAAAVGDGAAGEGGLHVDVVLVAEGLGDVLAVLDAAGCLDGAVGLAGGRDLVGRVRCGVLGGKRGVCDEGAAGGQGGASLDEAPTIHAHDEPPYPASAGQLGLAPRGVSAGVFDCPH